MLPGDQRWEGQHELNPHRRLVYGPASLPGGLLRVHTWVTSKWSKRKLKTASKAQVRTLTSDGPLAPLLPHTTSDSCSHESLDVRGATWRAPHSLVKLLTKLREGWRNESSHEAGRSLTEHYFLCLLQLICTFFPSLIG